MKIQLFIVSNSCLKSRVGEESFGGRRENAGVEFQG
jgi:hypothetical protein